MGLILKYFVVLGGKLPLMFRSALGRFAGVLFSFFPTRERKIAKLQMDIFLKEEGGSSHVVDMYASLGQTFMECLNLKPMLDQFDRYIECPNKELFCRSRDTQRPTIILTAHTGNWDLMGAYVVSLGVRVATAGKPMRDDSIQKILSEIREGYGIKTHWRSDIKGSKELIRDLKDNYMVAALVDQDTKVKSIHVPFFDRPAKCPSGLISLGKRYNAMFVSSFCFRIGFQKYIIYVDDIDSSLSVEDILLEFNVRLEKYLRQYPGQWVWIHKRWRSTEDGHNMSTANYIEHLSEALIHETR